ncbi:hypothetical protein QA612_04575 [Evansella sp. AB-P1]|uniref:hypothetical protein n=1 Tax=Evansella sp. AB-P1 TaxID=3037653 RepID=UPI00241CBF80|nr:hypothetical protein [Evansella sp. AB-P1]MDG5786756.1 hypothetical protein [Evansella sp. AB-P1]
MHDVKLLDKEKKILLIKWIGMVEPNEILEANTKLKESIESFSSPGFDLLVDMTNVKVMKQDTRDELVKHQQMLLTLGMNRAAVVVQGALAKMQLNRTTRESKHEREFHFDTYEQAYKYLIAN